MIIMDDIQRTVNQILLKKMDKSLTFSLFDYYFRSKEDILLSYKGPFESQVLTAIGNYINAVVGKNKRVSKKLFKIFIELAQNVAYYSSEQNVLGNENQIGIGSLVIVERPDYYLLVAGNIVPKSDILLLIEKCEHINSLDEDALREYKRKQLLLPDSSREGANIGLIKVALTSDNPLGIAEEMVDEITSFMSITVKIDKELHLQNQ